METPRDENERGKGARSSLEGLRDMKLGNEKRAPAPQEQTQSQMCATQKLPPTGQTSQVDKVDRLTRPQRLKSSLSNSKKASIPWPHFRVF